MALRIPWEVVDVTSAEDLAEARAVSARDRKERFPWEVPTGAVTDDLLGHVGKAAEAAGHDALQKTVAANAAARSGEKRI